MMADRYKRPVGAYVPPAKRVKSEKFDVGSEEYQRASWDENKRKITGLINRASAENVQTIVLELFKCNLRRYKGLFASSLLKAQEMSPVYTDVYAAILAIINSRIRSIGLLVINRLILQYRLAFINNQKPKCLGSVKFIAHLLNQKVVNDELGFQVIHHLINKPTPSSIEIAITFLRECGAKLDEQNSAYLFKIFKALRDLSYENEFDTRTQELIDLIHDIRRNKFKDYPTIKPQLDLLEECDIFTHDVGLDKPKREDFHMEFNYFKFDPNWAANEAIYEEDKKIILGEGSSDDDDDESESDDDSDETSEEEAGQPIRGEAESDVKPVIKKEEGEETKEKIVDNTGTDLIAFRRMVYLTIRSSVRHEEVVHKLMKYRIPSELNNELCQMILDCCGQERTYESIYGLVASKLCQMNRREFSPKFEALLAQFYEAVHRFEMIKIRNVAKFYSHLLTTETIDWSCMSCLSLREGATSSAGRCFLKILFQELASVLSLPKLRDYVHDPSRQDAFKNLFPKDQEEDIRFAINFFTSCELGELTEELRRDLLSFIN